MSEAFFTLPNFKQKLFFLFFMCLLVGIALPQVSLAATYLLTPADGSFEVGKTFAVRIMVNAGTDAVNTGEATITYDTSKLTAVSVSKEGSPFNLWVVEPKISGGTITFSGGGTTAISGSKAVATITFKAKAEGSAKVEFTKSTLLAGAGQNVLSGSAGATFTVTPASAKPDPVASTPTTPTQEKNTKIPPPDAPDITSTTHPDQGLWYNKADAKFTWDIPYGVLGVRFAFGNVPNATSTEKHEPPVGEWSKSGIPDGTWYFTAEYLNRGGWGSSTPYKLQIDTTPPDEFGVTAVGGDLTAQLRFEAQDSLSGVELYRVVIDGESPRDVQPNELVSGGYTITNLDPGDHTIGVTAVDFAGNERSAEAPVTVTGTKVEEVDPNAVTTSGFGAIYWVSLLFMAALAIVITMLIQERRRFHEEKDHIKRETAEVGDRLINIFGVLRDEIEEKVLELSHKPNMTDAERAILEGLKDALDISEELIDKEVEDVRKLLK